MGQDKTDKTQTRRMLVLLSYNVPKLPRCHGSSPTCFELSRRLFVFPPDSSDITSYMNRHHRQLGERAGQNKSILV